MTRLKANSGSRAASTSTPPNDDARVTDMINGFLVSNPSASTKKSSQKEPEIIVLQEYAKSGKAASVPGINKIKVIADFLNGKRY